MDSCSRCNWSGPAGQATCPRCGAPLGAAPDLAPTLVQTSARPVLLLKLLGGELPPEEWEIEGVQVGIGRLDDSDITLPHRSVSRHHARIVPSGNGYEVEDLGSTNGTWLNDKPLNDRVALSDGDSLMVGDIPLVVELIQPQRPTQPEVYDIPQLPAAPARGAQAPEGGASTVFYELDAALAAAGPAEPAPPPLQPAPPPADYQRFQPAQPPADYQRTQTAPLADYEQAAQPKPAQPSADYQHTQSAPLADYQQTISPQPAQSPADYQFGQPATPPADYQKTITPQPAQPPADYQRTPLQPTQRPADYKQTPPPFEMPTPAQPPAGYRRTPPPAPPPPPIELPPREVEVPRAWDDTPSTKIDLPSPSDLADNDEHPTLIGQVPVEQFQVPATVEPPRSAVAPPRVAPREPSPASARDPWSAAPPPSSYVPAPSSPQPSPRAPASPTGPSTAERQPWPSQPTPSAAPASGSPDLSAAALIDLAEHLATALRVLKGDLALAMWLFEHAGGPGAAQEFVDYARRLQADPNNPQDQADVLESAAGAARLLEAAILLVNVVQSLDPAGGIDNQLEADAANLQPVARS